MNSPIIMESPNLQVMLLASILNQKNMKKIILILTLTLIILLKGFSQNYIYRGDNQYKATKSWSFILNGHYWTGNPEFTVAKHSNGGYLMISIEVPFKSDYIGGTVTIFLNDGLTLKCTDKGMRDHVDNKSIALYNFTKTEIERLSQNRITMIRFSILGRSDGAQTFTADNRKYFNEGIADKEYETEVEISNLFE